VQVIPTGLQDQQAALMADRPFSVADLGIDGEIDVAAEPHRDRPNGRITGR